MQTIKMANHAAVWNNNIYNYEHAEDNLRMLFCLKGCPKGRSSVPLWTMAEGLPVYKIKA